MKISKISARQILDSRGIPTVEVDVTLDDKTTARAAVPSGASTGSHEAVELRDSDKDLFDGKSVLKAVKNVNQDISKALVGREAENQTEIDQIMINLDGTDNKSKLGANATLGVSMAVCRAAALSQNMPLYSYIGQLAGNSQFQIPRPMILLLEGGKHGNWSTDLQEFMIMPGQDRFKDFSKLLAAGVKIFYCLEGILSQKGYSTGLGFEGAFCPKEISSNEEAFQLLVDAINGAGFTAGQDFFLAVDGAATEFFENGSYVLKSEKGQSFTPRQWSEQIISWAKKYPIISLEDMHQEDLWEEWSYLTGQLGQTHHIVGDDLVTTNIQRIQQAAGQKAINAVLIKLNQIGTVTETLNAVALTKQSGWTPIISHRAGETNDDFISDFAVGTGSAECKFGGLSRGERISKYNQLLRIEEQFKK